METNNIVKLHIRANDGLILSGIYLAVDHPKAIVQIVYGMKEWKEKYIGLMKYFASLGISSFCFDNRGHGESINEKYVIGYFKSTSQIVHDQLKATKHFKKMFPNTPFFVYAHSFGTMIMRQYIQRHDYLLTGLIMSGTVAYIPLLRPVLALGRRLINRHGGMGKHISALFDKGPYDWICSDKAYMETLYKNEYWTNFKYTNLGFYSIGISDLELHNFSAFLLRNPKLRILSLTGEHDPFTFGKRGLKDTEASLRKVGYLDYTNIVLPNMNHEIYSETRKDIPMEIMSGFILNKPA